MNHYNLKTLANRLRLLTIPMPSVRSVTVLAMIAAGSRYETPQNNGISHFLEHMVFKGTKKYPTSLKLSTAVEEVGAEFNAFTAKEHTGFYVKVAGGQINRALDVVSQLIFAPLLPQKELEIERGVILEEIRMYEDRPMAKVGIDFETLLYSNTPLGWMTLGTMENIKKMSLKAFNDYLGEYYQPQRVILGIAGSEKVINQPKTARLVEQYFGQKGEINHAREAKKLTYIQTKSALRVIKKKTEQAHLCLGVRALPRGDRRRYDLAVLSALLGGGMSSRLFMEIREKRGLAYYVRSGAEAYLDNGYFVMQAGTEAKNIAEVVKIALAEFNKIKEGQIPDKEFNKAKEAIRGQFILSLEDSQSVAGLYVEDLLLENRVRTPAAIIQSLEKVTKVEVRQIAKDIFTNKRLNLAVITPDGEEEKLEEILKF